MHRLVRTLAAVAGVAVLTVANVAPCAGWASTPQERHDCCERRHCVHTSDNGQSAASQAAVDECCAIAERGPADRTEQWPVVQIARTAPVVGSVITRPADRTSPVETRLIHPPGPVPIHLRNSVFLI
jgi:hypothetical protein